MCGCIEWQCRRKKGERVGGTVATARVNRILVCVVCCNV